MTSAFNNRIIKVGIQINGDWIYFQDLDIRVQGQQFVSGTSPFCTVKLSNLTRDQRHWLLTSATPIQAEQKQPANLTVDIGREDRWMFQLFAGQVWTSTVTQPPDISITFRSVENNFLASALGGIGFGPYTQLRTIAQWIADNYQPKPLTLQFGEGIDRQILNYSSHLSANEQLTELNHMGGIVAFVANGLLIVRSPTGFYRNKGFVLSQQTGMVGIPQATESGVCAQMLASPDVQIGDLITMNSLINPSVNGQFRVDNLAFDLANRDTPFFYNLTLTSLTIPNAPPGTL